MVRGTMGRGDTAPRIFIVGAGRLGMAWALAAKDAGIPVVGAWSRSARSRRAARLVLGPVVADRLTREALSRATVILVCVSDDAIGHVAAHIARIDVGPRTVIAHCSGVQPAAALGTMAGALVASLHPLITCPDAEAGRRALCGALFVCEGDRRAFRVLTRLVDALSGRMVAIRPAAKARYHAAAVMAAGLTVTLATLASREAEAAGIRNVGPALSTLAIAALSNFARVGPKAFTGPLVRGDTRTVALHLSALGQAALPIYRALSLAALDAGTDFGIPKRKRAELAALLRRPRSSRLKKHGKLF